MRDGPAGVLDGVEDACNERNRLRDSIWVLAAELHPNEARRDKIRADLNYEDCDALGKSAVQMFERRLKDKTGTKELIIELQTKP